jgi:ATP-dependent exoDNAse (exonuclease V) beta subunit
MLRAPWCGLKLGDLLILAQGEGQATLWQLIQDEEQCRGLSSDGRERLQRLRSVLQTAFSERRRRPLRSWIEGVWLALGGAAIPQTESGLEEAQLFFELLQQCDEGSDLADLAALEAAIEKLHTPPDIAEDGAAPQIEIMTMHKAKGLEFDTVILPGLGRRPPREDHQLLQWLERPTGRSGSDLLLAPIKGAAEGEDQIYRYLKGIEGSKARFEQGRLLYVAATRAKKRLHMLAHTGYDLEQELPNRADATSLLGSLWPAVEDEFSQIAYRPAEEPELEPQQQRLRRLPLTWQGVKIDPAQWPQPEIESVDGAAGEDIPLEFDWAGEAARHVGSVVHRYLQHIAQDGCDTWNEGRIKALQPTFQRSLAHLGVAADLLEQAAERVELALLNTLSDQRGRWILSADHQQAKSEYALTAKREGGVTNVVIDRTFIDADGTRWIIDFKVSSHEGGSSEVFLDREQQRYRHQLENYASIFKRIEKRPIKMGLYFPLLCGWRSWD